MAELQNMNLNTQSNLYHEQLYLEQKILNLILISKTAPELSYGILWILRNRLNRFAH